MKINMKLLVAVLFIFVTSLSSCSDDDDNSTEVLLSDTEIPTEIGTYIETHFTSNTIIQAEKETEANTITYEIFLSDDVNLEFDSELNVTEIESTLELPDSVIPELVLDYVATNYPDNFIIEWELETDYQQIKLDNNVELEFDMDGAFIRIDND
ncbi:PepSY-like domain-containing protein [Marinifilum sp. RC60d5]|uniref:PepSY-like domain-containing protein n=1 Tax=Marinifilum sp. RC60d5 TaxID=3458414 RepID=UPI0040358488